MSLVVEALWLVNAPAGWLARVRSFGRRRAFLRELLACRAELGVAVSVLPAGRAPVDPPVEWPAVLAATGAGVVVLVPRRALLSCLRPGELRAHVLGFAAFRGLSFPADLLP